MKSSEHFISKVKSLVLQQNDSLVNFKIVGVFVVVPVGEAVCGAKYLGDR
jgi:hypothetical protein